MGIIGDLKDVGEVLQKAGSIDLYQKLIDFQEKALELIETNSALREDNDRLKREIETNQKLEFKANAYWIPQNTTNDKGPFCSKCYDHEKKVIHLHECKSPYGVTYFHCPLCRNDIY